MIVKKTPGRVGDHVPPVRYVPWYRVVMIGVFMSSIHTRAVQSPTDMKYFGNHGFRSSEYTGPWWP